MPVKPEFDPAYLYFITTNAVNHAHFFRHAPNKQIIADSLAYIRKQRWIQIHAFVIMPNHLHLIARFLPPHTLSDVMRDFKKYTAKEIVKHYRAQNNEKALTFLRKGAADSAAGRHQVWEKGYDAREVFTLRFFRQKAEYIHNNPCQPHWRLVEVPEAYLWSSARYYALGEPTVVPVDMIEGW